MSSFKAKTH